jgi:hypothetical protein
MRIILNYIIIIIIIDNPKSKIFCLSNNWNIYLVFKKKFQRKESALILQHEAWLFRIWGILGSIEGPKIGFNYRRLDNPFWSQYNETFMGRNSSVGIATRYGLDRPEIEC